MASALESAKQLSVQFSDLVSAPAEFRGEISVVVKDPTRIPEVMQFVKKTLSFEMLMDISSIDHMGDEPRFEIVYHVYSFKHQHYLRLKTTAGEEKSEVPTISHIWKGADWHEREIFDMMGIRFKDHPDLRRILMWEDYPYFPLRKEFPLAGKPVNEVVKPAPLAGGPFVTSPGDKTTVDREPRGKGETDSIVK
jgi:NADH-quinone oxidoreductase subunit C